MAMTKASGKRRDAKLDEMAEAVLGYREALLSLGVATQKLAWRPYGSGPAADGRRLSHRDRYDDALGEANMRQRRVLAAARKLGFDGKGARLLAEKKDMSIDSAFIKVDIARDCRRRG